MWRTEVTVGGLSHVSTHGYIHVSFHAVLSQLGHMAILHHYLENLQDTRGNILSRPFVHWVARIPLVALNLLWYVKPWLADTRLIDKILPILTSTSVDKNVKSQVISKIKRTTSYVMTRHLTQPPVILQIWWLPCHYCAIIITMASSALLSPPPPSNTIKTLV